MMTENTL